MHDIRHRIIRLMHVLMLALALPAASFAATDITPEELLQRQAKGDVVVVDVRTPREYATGHVPGALNIPQEQADARADEFRALQKKGEVVLYCHSGRRAALVAGALEARGLTGLRHLAGDMQGWQAAGRPLEKAAASGGADQAPAKQAAPVH